MYSNEQALYFKEYITLKNTGDVVARIGSSLYESKISLNPHQINAALMFLKNPKKQGMIFADEVGLGKTIEAGLIISQYWYEKKNRILIMCPASLIKQWNEELFEKFHLESNIIDSKCIKDNDFKWGNNIYICSINTIYLNKEKFVSVFDLIVIDEAHKLRNVYKDKGLMAPAIKDVFRGQKKLLLSATPFQNNLLELYGLVSLIDENIFPDLKVFKAKYINGFESNRSELRSLLKNYLVRTLRRDVTQYINYTKRNVLLKRYSSTFEENEIYKLISNLMYSDNFSELYSSGQNQLLIILLQKLLSSSIYAVTSTLNKMMDNISNSIEIEDIDSEKNINIKLDLSSEKKIKLRSNIENTLSYIAQVHTDSKYKCLKDTIVELFDNMRNQPERNNKILIFTESKQTQKYLYQKLTNDLENSILLFNGDNSGEQTAELYQKWLEKNNINQGTRSVNLRRATIDAFQNDYDILIATDVAAEGLNIQFCSNVINYDLPWNPQKIEQRIGRCHRYGQKNDVIVVNLLNDSSKIDKRIYELLSFKLGIFEETFGSSDAILNNSNVSDNIEQTIRDIYRRCRNYTEIEQEFEKIQEQFRDEIEEALKISENKLDEFFDAEVSKVFDLQFIEAKQVVDEIEEVFYLLIKSVLKPTDFDDKEYAFTFNESKYSVAKNNLNYEFCYLSSELGQHVLGQTDELKINYNSSVEFNYSNSKKKIGFLDNHIGKRGKLSISKIVYNSFELNEALVLTGQFSDGTSIPSDICHKILKLESYDRLSLNLDIDIKNRHNEDIAYALQQIEKHNTQIFSEELRYIDNWADSMIEKIQLEVAELRQERKQYQLDYFYATNINEKSDIQEKISKISRKINRKWIELASGEDEIELKRTQMINNLKLEKNKSVNTHNLLDMEFIIR